MTLTPRWQFSFYVAGIPAPGGSKTAFVARRGDGSIVMRKGTNVPVVNMTDAGKGNKRWRSMVAWTAKQQWTAKPLTGPCVLDCVFYMPRPSSHYRTGRYAAVLRDDAPAWHMGTPDASKLRRSTEDALTGLVYEDDKQIQSGSQSKQYCNGTEKPGCLITVKAL